MISKIAKLTFSSVFLLIIGCAEAKSESRFYHISIFSESSFVQIYVNDAEIAKTYNFKGFNATENLKKYLRNGVNEVVIDVAPVDAENKSYVFNNKVKLEIIVEGYSRVNGQRVNESKIHLASLVFDNEGRAIHKNEGVFTNIPTNDKSLNLTKVGFEELGDSAIRYNANYATVNTKRFRLLFDVQDESIVDPVWVDAKSIKKIEDVEHQVFEKYKEIWKTFDENDFSDYVRLLEDVLSRTAYVTGYKDSAEVAEKLFPDSALVPNGKSLMSIREWENKYDASYVSISPNGKLFSFKPNPVRFFNDQGEDDFSMSYYFCMKSTGEVDVCYQKDTGM
jgi:hypothetical protein